MQTTVYKKSTAKSLVDGLIEIGYSKEKAINIYNKYKYWNKLQDLEQYILSKEKKSNSKNYRTSKRTGVMLDGME